MKRNILGAFPTESVILHKASGEIIDNIDALVESDKFFIDDADIVIEEGDFFERNLPNGSKEYYRVTDRGFYKGMHEIPDHYQTSVEKVSASVMERGLAFNGTQTVDGETMMGQKQHKVFISHSSEDKDYMVAFVELLEDIGMPDGSIVCTSVPGHGIPGGAKIYDWLREQFTDCDIRVIYALSKNYYASPASLNEMGAAWVTKASSNLMLLPGFHFDDIRGCIDRTEVGIELAGEESELKYRLDELKDVILSEHSLPAITSARWERHRDGFIRAVNEIATGKQEEESERQSIIEQKNEETTETQKIPIDIVILVTYTADADGRIMKSSSISSVSGIDFSIDGESIMKEDSNREAARWEEAMDKMLSWRWLKRVPSKKCEIYSLTNEGYKMADLFKKQMEIDTSKDFRETLSCYE